MDKKTPISKKTMSLMSDFFTQFKIRSMKIDKGLGVTNSIEISDINFQFIEDRADESLDYSVEFKLQQESADICQCLKAIITEPEFSVELTSLSNRTGAEILNNKLQTFIELIRERIKSVQKEQIVQNISYVGNTFILNNSTKFKVLSDEGEGRLNIEILTKDLPLDALLTASGLLDGLYLGSIKLIESDCN